MVSPRILIIKLSSIGDVVHALPALMTLRTYYPDAYIAWAVEEKSFDILAGNPELNEVILFERKKISRLFKTGHGLKGWKEINKLKQHLRSQQFDISIDLQGLARSAFIAYLANAKTRIGCPGMKEFSYLISTPPPFSKIRNLKSEIRNITSAHAVDRSLQTVQSLDSQIKPVIEFPIIIPEADKQLVTEFLQQNRIGKTDIIIGINIGASIPLNIWLKEKFAQLIDRLILEEHYRVVLIGGPTDIEFAQAVGSLAVATPINTVGKMNLKQLAGLTQRCTVVVSGDTAPLHIAAAMGTPVVAIFGPADPNKTGPYTDKKVVIWKKPECSPCLKKTGCDHNILCMELITVDEVITAIKQLHE
jgi:heptosyltransferase I